MERNPNVVFVNKPDIGYIEEVLLNLLSKQEGWGLEFKVTATLKPEYQEEALSNQ